jgi:hypothetical protein
MPLAQITLRVQDLSSTTPSIPNNYTAANTSITPFTAYPQVNLAGRYKCRLLGVNWADTLGAGTSAANNAIVVVDSSTWQFPGNGQRGYQFSNKTDHIQLTGPDCPYWEIRNTGATMDISIYVLQNSAASTWTTLGWQFIILTLDLEKIDEMV